MYRPKALRSPVWTACDSIFISSSSVRRLWCLPEPRPTARSRSRISSDFLKLRAFLASVRSRTSASISSSGWLPSFAVGRRTSKAHRIAKRTLARPVRSFRKTNPRPSRCSSHAHTRRRLPVLRPCSDRHPWHREIAAAPRRFVSQHLSSRLAETCRNLNGAGSSAAVQWKFGHSSIRPR